MYNSQPKHLNTFVLKIINYIKGKNKECSFYEIKEQLNINLLLNPGLVSLLKKNPRLEIKNNFIIYKPLFRFSNAEEFLNLIKTSNEGILLNDLLETHSDVSDWLVQFASFLHILKDNDETSIVFYNCFDVNKAPLEVINLYSRIKVPNYSDMINELMNAGLTIHKTVMVKKKQLPVKAKRYKRKIKITNTHIKGIDFEEE